MTLKINCPHCAEPLAKTLAHVEAGPCPQERGMRFLLAGIIVSHLGTELRRASLLEALTGVLMWENPDTMTAVRDHLRVATALIDAMPASDHEATLGHDCGEWGNATNVPAPPEVFGL